MGNSRVFNPGIRRGVLSGAASLIALAVFGAAGVARAETVSVAEVVSRAAAKNPSLRAALLDARAAHAAAEAERGARDPSLVATLQSEHTETVTRPGLSGLGGGADAASRSVQNGLSADAAVTYTTDVGTQLELGTRTGTLWNSTTWSGTGALPDNLSVGPTYSAQAYAGVRQPLLRGAGADAELAPLEQARASARAADDRQRETASQTTLDVLSAYWELWYADRALAVQEQAREVAERLVNDARVRATTLGTGSAVDVLQFQTNLASIAEALSQARADREARAIELGRVLGLPPAEAAALDAAGEPPDFGPVPALDALVVESPQRSPALAALRADLDSARVRVRAARDANQPRVDLFVNGSVGTLWDRGSDFSLTGGRPTFGVIGGIELELPLGGGRYPADAAAAQANLEAAEARYQAALDSVAASVGSLAVNARAASEQVGLATETASAASQLADAERQRLQLGTTTSRDVVSAEQTSREAELRRLRAIVSEASTRLSLEHSAGILLDRYASALTQNGKSS
jgi:outer membrane protein